jgi:hypothetical protein
LKEVLKRRNLTGNGELFLGIEDIIMMQRSYQGSFQELN